MQRKRVYLNFTFLNSSEDRTKRFLHLIRVNYVIQNEEKAHLNKCRIFNFFSRKLELIFISSELVRVVKFLKQYEIIFINAWLHKHLQSYLLFVSHLLLMMNIHWWVSLGLKIMNETWPLLKRAKNMSQWNFKWHY